MPEYVTVPGICVVPCRRITVAVLIVSGFIASLKFATRFEVVVTRVAPLAGVVEVTVGAVVC